MLGMRSRLGFVGDAAKERRALTLRSVNELKLQALHISVGKTAQALLLGSGSTSPRTGILLGPRHIYVPQVVDMRRLPVSRRAHGRVGAGTRDPAYSISALTSGLFEQMRKQSCKHHPADSADLAMSRCQWTTSESAIAPRYIA